MSTHICIKHKPYILSIQLSLITYTKKVLQLQRKCLKIIVLTYIYIYVECVAPQGTMEGF